ncbi:DUF4265 domain-containing protein [Microbacterium sp. NPDC087868]|uniref:DUF4265 domain-containing protein n=1 Tax=Microbacterium sp. NPDC087868 TaxID=3364195 RepID=UPI00384A69B8
MVKWWRVADAVRAWRGRAADARPHYARVHSNEVTELAWHEPVIEDAVAWSRRSLEGGSALCEQVAVRLAEVESARVIAPVVDAAALDDFSRGVHLDAADAVIDEFLSAMADADVLVVEDDLLRRGDRWVEADSAYIGDRVLRWTALDSSPSSLLRAGASGYPLNGFVCDRSAKPLLVEGGEPSEEDVTALAGSVRAVVNSAYDGESYAVAEMKREKSPAETFAVHASPIWRERANFILQARLEEPWRYEQLWTRRISETEVEVCCIPFFLYDVALGDRVSTRAEGPWNHIFDRVVEDAGHYGFRVFFPAGTHRHEGTLIAEVRDLGALVEISSKSLLAIDSYDEAHAQIIADYLLAAEREFGIVYETSRSGSEPDSTSLEGDDESGK